MSLPLPSVHILSGPSPEPPSTSRTNSADEMTRLRNGECMKGVPSVAVLLPV